MANEIDLVVGSEAFAQIAKLLVALGEVDTKFTELSANFAALGKNANTVKSTADLAKLTAENAKLTNTINELTKSYESLNKKLSENVSKSVEKSKYTTQETTDLRLVNKELSLQNTKASELAGAYEKLSAAHKIARESAANLAAIQGVNSKEFLTAAANANTLDKKLKEIDQQLGQHGRHVGDYSRSWNGLGNSINQITREAPAFANSLNTGFMALSNNLPILADELDNLRLKNKELAATGKPTVSVLKQLADGFFSWQTLISVGVTLLTVYGGKLIDAMSGANKLKQATDSLTNSIKLQNDELDKTIKKLEYNTEIEIELAKLRGATEKELSDLRIKLGVDTTSAIEKQYDKQVQKIDSFDAYRLLAATNRGAAETFLEKKLGLTMLEARKEFQRREVVYSDETRKQLIKSRDDLYKKLQESNDKNALQDLRSKNELNTANEKQNKKDNTLAEKAAKAEEERLKNLYELKLSNAEREKEVYKDLLVDFDGTLKKQTELSMKMADREVKIANIVFDEKKRLAKGDQVLIQTAENDKTTSIENAAQNNITRVQKMYSDIFKAAEQKFPKTIFGDKFKLSEEDKKNNDESVAYIKKNLDELHSYISSFSSDLGERLGLKETFNSFIKIDEKGNTMWDRIDKSGASKSEKFAARFNMIAESAQEAFKIIDDASTKNYENDLKRLDAQKEISLKFAGDNEAAKAKIEADFVKKKHELDVKQFKEKQKIAVVNIAIDTAQAVMATLGTTGFFGSPLALAVAAMGAVEAGIVLSQKPPAYAEGTDNHNGGLMLVNDGSGSNFQEKVILPSGKVIMPQGRNVLMDAPKGTKVLNHEQQLFEMLQSNNISMLSPQNQGMTSEEMDEILGKHFGNIKTQNTIFDKNGFQTYVRNGNSITRSNSNRSQSIGISV